MVKKLEKKNLALLNIYRFFLCLGILENILATWYLFSIPTKTKIVFLAGFSMQRIGASFAIFFLMGVYFFSPLRFVQIPEISQIPHIQTGNYP